MALIDEKKEKKVSPHSPVFGFVDSGVVAPGDSPISGADCNLHGYLYTANLMYHKENKGKVNVT